MLKCFKICQKTNCSSAVRSKPQLRDIIDVIEVVVISVVVDVVIVALDVDVADVYGH